MSWISWFKGTFLLLLAFKTTCVVSKGQKLFAHNNKWAADPIRHPGPCVLLSIIISIRTHFPVSIIQYLWKMFCMCVCVKKQCGKKPLWRHEGFRTVVEIIRKKDR